MKVGRLICYIERIGRLLIEGSGYRRTIYLIHRNSTVLIDAHYLRGDYDHVVLVDGSCY